jgi:CBS domain-containing protein
MSHRIVTDTDMSSKIATGRFPITVAVHKIMSTPVVTVLENVSLAEAQLLMLKKCAPLYVQMDNKSIVKLFQNMI